jgi:small-conductance mechanosensitive channel
MRGDNSPHLVTAAQQRAEQTRRRAVAALRRMDDAGTPISFQSVAREARVSRSWLYAHADLRHEIDRLRARHQTQTATTPPPERQRASTTSLLRRLEAAAERITHLERDNRELRDALAQALGEQRTSAILGTTRRRDTPEKTNSKVTGPC